MKWTVGVQHQSPRSYDFLEMQHKMGVGVALKSPKIYYILRFPGTSGNVGSWDINDITPTISSDFIENYHEMGERG